MSGMGAAIAGPLQGSPVAQAAEVWRVFTQIVAAKAQATWRIEDQIKDGRYQTNSRRSQETYRRVSFEEVSRAVPLVAGQIMQLARRYNYDVTGEWE